MATVSVWIYITVTKVPTVSVWIYITVKKWPQLVYEYILQLQKCPQLVYEYITVKKMAKVSVWIYITVHITKTSFVSWPYYVFLVELRTYFNFNHSAVVLIKILQN